MFTTHPSLSAHFEAPTFSPGVPSRELRNRLRLLEYANRAGLLPEIEWELICKAINEHLLEDGDNDVEKTLTDLRTVSQESIKGEKHTPIDPFIYLATTSRIDVVEEQPSTTTSNNSCEDKDDSIKTTLNLGKKKKIKKNEYETKSLVPISPNRRGSAEDIALPYSMELWRKAKTLNRDRSVFGCALAHLIAMKTLIGDNNYEKSDDLSSHHEATHFDFILEDNVRAFVGIESNACCECASLIWDMIETSNNATDKPHLRYYGYLGSKPNLKWLYSQHIPRKSFSNRTGEGDGCAIFPFPTNDDFLLDSIDGRSKSSSTRATNETEATAPNGSEDLSKGQPYFDTPGGTAIWGMFAYTISPAAYHALIEQLRNDVGMLMWKGKRMRAYQAKAIDKIIPRTVRETFGETAIHLSNKVAFVRAPMLGSLLHKQWEQGFCESTELQHELSNQGKACDVWDHVWLEEEERFIVDYRKKNGNWIRKEDMLENLSSKSNGTTTTRGRSQSPANIVLLSIISMVLLANTLASAFTMNPMHTIQQKGMLHLGSTMKSNAEAVLANGEKRERAMLGNVPIISRTITIAKDMNVTVWELERPSSLIQEWWSLDENERESRVGDPFGVVMWPGSIVASKELMKQQESVVNATVLVLGAGTGVEAFAAAMLGASKVIATDINPLSLQLLGYGAQRMEGIGNVVEAVHFDLFSSEPLPPCDILVAADTLYNEHLAKQVGHRLHEAIVRSFDVGDSPTKVLVTDSQQFHGTDFLQEKEMVELNALFQQGGWKPLQWELEKLKNVRGSGVLIDEDQTYDVDVRAIRWGWDDQC